MALKETQDKQRTIMGLDLVPSPHHMQEYALVVINEKGVVIDRREGVDWDSVYRLIRKYRVDTLAVDNVYEIGETLNDVKKRLGKVIDKVRLVEVTKVGEQHIKLAELAFKEGLLSERVSHLSPLQAAEVSALLALRGVGTTVIEPSNVRTVVLISRGRSLGSGGMSQGRYGRSQRSAIKQVTNLIFDELRKHVDANEIECYVQKSKYGLERSIFIISLPPSKVKRLLKPFRELIKKSGVNLRIVTKISTFDERYVEDKHYEERPVIIGLDPGIVAGIAVMDLNGNLLFVDSGLALDKMSIVRMVTKFGNPVIVASDVRCAPMIVEKIASILGCLIYTPPRDLSVEEKRRIIQEHIANFKEVIKNSHQRDAVAAALKAYFNFKNKFMQLEAKARELNLSRLQIERAKALVIRGLTIKEAIEKVSLDQKIERSRPALHVDPEVQKLKQELSRLRDKVEEQNKVIKDLEESRLRLLQQLKEKETKIAELEESLMKASVKAQQALQEDSVLMRRLEMSMRTISELKAKVESLELTIERLKNFLKEAVKGDILIIKEIRSLTKRSIEEAVKYGALGKEEIILVNDPSSSNAEGLLQLLKVKPKAIITSVGKVPEEVRLLLKENCIPLIDLKEVKVERISDFLYVSSTVKELIESRKKILALERDKSLRERLKEMLQKYREERARELEGRSAGSSKI